MGAFEDFVNTELPLRIAVSANPTDDYYLRSTGVAKMVEARSPAQVLSDIGASASGHDHPASDIVSGILALARGGTNAASYTNSQLLRMNSGGTAFESSGKVIGDFAAAGHDHDADYSDIAHGHTIDDLTDAIITSAERGDVLFHNGSNWVNLHHGTDGYFLKTQGHGADPVWAAAAGGSSTLDALTDTDIDGTPAANEVLAWDGSNWANQTAEEAGLADDSHAATHNDSGADELNHDNLAGFVAGEHYLQSAIVATGTVASGTWAGTDVGIAHGGTGQSTQQAAIDALTDASGADSGDVLTSDGTNASFQAPATKMTPMFMHPLAGLHVQALVPVLYVGEKPAMIYTDDDTPDPYTYFGPFPVTNYGGGARKITIYYSLVTAALGSGPYGIQWSIQSSVYTPDDSEDITGGGTNTDADEAVIASSQAKDILLSYTDTFADISGHALFVEGDMMYVRIERDTSHANDDLANEVYVWMAKVWED